MPIETVAGTTAASGSSMYSSAPTRTPKQEMDSELFMNLLVTQMQNQDPSSPMDTNAMISQFTELASMEKLNNMAETSEEGFSLQMRTAAAALIGQTVTYTGADGKDVTGMAKSVSYAAGVPTVNIDGVAVNLDSISSVTS